MHGCLIGLVLDSSHCELLSLATEGFGLIGTAREDSGAGSGASGGAAALGAVLGLGGTNAVLL